MHNQPKAQAELPADVTASRNMIKALADSFQNALKETNLPLKLVVAEKRNENQSYNVEMQLVDLKTGEPVLKNIAHYFNLDKGANADLTISRELTVNSENHHLTGSESKLNPQSRNISPSGFFDEYLRRAVAAVVGSEALAQLEQIAGPAASLPLVPGRPMINGRFMH